MQTKPQIIIIGLDGATWKVLHPLVKAGKLPFLHSQIKQGASGILQSTIPSVSAAAWASFQTGTNPGKHGIYYFLHRRDNPQNPPLINSQTIFGKKIWQYLNDAGLTTLMVNMPLSYPVTPVNGILISSFLTPAHTPYAYPPELEADLKAAGYQIDLQSGSPLNLIPQKEMSKNDRENIFQQTQAIYRQRTQVFIDLFRQQTFDFAFLYYKASDTLQHILWDTPTLSEFWQDIDRQLSKIYQACASKTKKQYWFVISDHGFHAISHISFAVYPWLTKILALKPPQESAQTYTTQSLRRLYAKLKQSGLDIGRLPLIRQSRQKVIQHLEADTGNTLFSQYGILPTIEGVYLFNRRRTSKTISRIVKLAASLTHHGNPVFNLVKPAHQIYSGNKIDQAPDVVWHINPQFSLDTSPLTKEVFHASTSHLKAEHFGDAEGIFTLTGSQITPQSGLHANIMDILPSLLHLNRLKIPSIVDGTPMPWLPSIPTPSTKEAYAQHISI